MWVTRVGPQGSTYPLGTATAGCKYNLRSVRVVRDLGLDPLHLLSLTGDLGPAVLPSLPVTSDLFTHYSVLVRTVDCI